MKKAIFLLDNIINNMEYVKLLLIEGHELPPLDTYYLIIKRLNELKSILENKQKFNLDDLFKPNDSQVGGVDDIKGE